MIKRFGQAARQEINPRLLDRLADQVEPDVGNRATIARMMASQRNPSDAVKDQLADVARHDPVAEVRQAALYAIGRLATDDRLLTLLPGILTEDEDASVKRMAAIRLGRMGVRAAGAAPQLAAVMEEDDEALSDAAAQALIKIGPKTLPVLVTALESSRPRTRRLAILALSTMGREAQPAVKALQRRLADDEADIRQLARMTIKKILLLQ
jgi:HEAT repeat protein